MIAPFTVSVAQLVKITFIEFLIRDMGFTRVEAEMEVSFVFANPLRLVTREHYILRVRRIGQTKTLTRAERASVWMSLENAINHSTAI